MRDWFAFALAPKQGATGAAGATSARKPRNSTALPVRGADAPADGTRAPGATPSRHAPADYPVAPVARPAELGATAPQVPASAKIRRSEGDAAPVARAALEFGHGFDESEAADWRFRFEERAAFLEFCGRYRRDMAEQLAYGDCIERWYELHPLQHQPAFCDGCGAPLAADVLDLPDGGRVHWEHYREFTCLIAYGFTRKLRAVQALAALGLQPPERWKA